MDEYVAGMYLREEEFLEVFYGTVEAVLPQLGCDWRPNFQCDDAARWRRDRQLREGSLEALTFDSAVIFHGKEGFSSIRLYLRSSARLIVLRLRWSDDGLRVESLHDGATRQKVRSSS